MTYQDDVTNFSEPKLAVSLEGPFKMKAETKLSLTPSKCDDIEFFGEQMNVCAEETITKVFFLILSHLVRIGETI